MTFKKSTLALMMASTVALTGCLSDDYDYSGDGHGGATGSKLTAQVPLYHNDPKVHTSPYIMAAVDKHDMEGDVDGQENASLENIQVTGNFQSIEPLTVKVSEDKASLVFKANKEYDITAANNSVDGQGGTVQFYVQTKHYDIGEGEERNKVMLTMGNGNNTHSIDITSAMAAAAVTETGTAQWIRVPLSCFVDQGLDLGGVDFAMGIESEGAIEYEFSQARLASNSVPEVVGTNNVQGCLNNNNSEILTDDVTVLNIETRVNGEWEAQGKTEEFRVMRGSSMQSNPGSWEHGGTHEGAIRFRGISYDDKFDPNRRSTLTFIIDGELGNMDQPRLDMSHYLDKGELQMAFFIPGTATVPTGDLKLVLSLESPAVNTDGEPTPGLPAGGYGNSETVSYNLTQAGAEQTEVHHISIPLRDLFTKTNVNSGAETVSLNALQYVEKLVTHIEQTNTDGEADFSNLSGLIYSLADIKIVMNPDAK
ncbi:hypothetical protein L4D09_16665 [Photobacterium makurazakiensis]|uniref:putative glycoside hydrolase n=1 Tax=Photobacterium makurazakiensis TaxID=2910234 RepID=UPI003D0A8B8B